MTAGRVEPRIVEMGCEHVAGCAAIVAATPLLAGDYGLDGPRARELLDGALDAGDPRVVLHVALDHTSGVLGFTWFVRRGAFDRSGYLRLIAVAEAARGAGVGRALMGDLERRYLEQGGVALLVSAHNDAARRFYQRLGYEEVGELRDYVAPGLHERILFKR